MGETVELSSVLYKQPGHLGLGLVDKGPRPSGAGATRQPRMSRGIGEGGAAFGELWGVLTSLVGSTTDAFSFSPWRYALSMRLNYAAPRRNLEQAC